MPQASASHPHLVVFACDVQVPGVVPQELCQEALKIIKLVPSHSLAPADALRAECTGVDTHEPPIFLFLCAVMS
jgi:hypothetical protein